MSLKVKYRMLRMNDNPHEQPGAVDAGRDGGIRNQQPSRELVGDRGRVGVRIHRASAESATVPPTEQRPKEHREEVSGQGNRSKPCANDAADSTVGENAANRAATGATGHLPAP